jgi:hypothetical protein
MKGREYHIWKREEFFGCYLIFKSNNLKWKDSWSKKKKKLQLKVVTKKKKLAHGDFDGAGELGL